MVSDEELGLRNHNAESVGEFQPRVVATLGNEMPREFFATLKELRMLAL
jgi:hypothetical protein